MQNELHFGKCFYSRSRIPERASLGPRLTGTTHILPKPPLPSPPPSLSSPKSPSQFLRSAAGAAAGRRRRLTFLPDSASTTQPRLGVLDAGALCVLLRGTSFSARAPDPLEGDHELHAPGLLQSPVSFPLLFLAKPF